MQNISKQKHRISFTALHRGFTIPELLVYIGFVALISIALVNLILVGERQEFNAVEKQVTRDVAVRLFDQLQEDIDTSSSINTPTHGDSGNSLNLTISSQTVVYSLSENRVTRQVGAGAPEFITPEAAAISALTFENYSEAVTGGAVTISFTINEAIFTSSFTRNDE